jgi:hypothetical protein
LAPNYGRQRLDSESLGSTYKAGKHVLRHHKV